VVVVRQTAWRYGTPQVLQLQSPGLALDYTFFDSNEFKIREVANDPLNVRRSPRLCASDIIDQFPLIFNAATNASMLSPLQSRLPTTTPTTHRHCIVFELIGVDAMRATVPIVCDLDVSAAWPTKIAGTLQFFSQQTSASFTFLNELLLRYQWDDPAFEGQLCWILSLFPSFESLSAVETSILDTYQTNQNEFDTRRNMCLRLYSVDECAIRAEPWAEILDSYWDLYQFVHSSVVERIALIEITSYRDVNAIFNNVTHDYQQSTFTDQNAHGM
jgi:hypothetical protein